MNRVALPRLIRTVAHLRPSQVLWRAWYAAQRKWAAPRTRRPNREVRARETYPDVPLFHRVGPQGETALDLLAGGRFRHLNRTVDVGRGRPDWHLGPRSSGRLWAMTLHYHGWAYELARVAASDSERGAQAAELYRHYLSDWIERCQATAEGALHLAWNSFAIATRASWWVRSYLLLRDSLFTAHPEFERRFLDSLWEQGAFLRDHLEWDLRGNHLLRDLSGLAWLGRFFEGREARGWLETAQRLTPGQIEEQVLQDGAHFERSPMYHIHVMEDLLALAFLFEERSFVERSRRVLGGMAEHLSWMRHPDGSIPLFNDAAHHQVCDPARMLALVSEHAGWSGSTDPWGGRHFADAGMAVWRGQPWVVFFDVGEVGPSYQPGHAHADTLGLECSHDGRPVFVDPGIWGYDADERRRYDRSTAAHNTVTVDGTDSSEVWDAFRVGRRARPGGVGVTFADGGFDAQAAHDGYRHLDGAPRHARRVRVTPAGRLTVEDQVTGKGHHRVEGGFLVAPGWDVRDEENGWTLEQDGRALRVRLRSDAPIVPGTVERAYHPGYGVERMTRRLCWSLDGRLPVRVEVEVEVEGV